MPIIMAGGSGSRLWPLSRDLYPKQFQALHGDLSMFQQALRRLTRLPVMDPITICRDKHRFFVAEQLRQMDQLGTIILEPVGRNTAPAVALAAFHEKDKSALLLVLAADHVIQDDEAFTQAVLKAIPLAAAGKLVTFGVRPTEPHTGYGYIEVGTACESGFEIASFKEKPNLETAKAYLSGGGCFWNSGIFLMRADRYLDELQKFRPDIYAVCEKSIDEGQSDLDFFRVEKTTFENCPEESIDYAVMEKTSDAIVLPMDVGWSDVGSWSSLWNIGEKNIDGNVTSGDVTLYDTSNTYVRSEDKLVATLGINDLVVVSTKDAVLVAHKDRVEDTSMIVQGLKSETRSEWELHREVYRPWGKYESIDRGKQYQVKRVTVNPGEKLSVQMHKHRAEHWVVVSGLAKITNGDTTLILSENQSTYIPRGVVHALENVGEAPLEIIEVQSGSYLGEDDIVRYEDKYGRASFDVSSCESDLPFSKA